MTTSPGSLRCFSLPSSMTRISSPRTIKHELLSDVMLMVRTEDVIVHGRRPMLDEVQQVSQSRHCRQPANHGSRRPRRNVRVAKIGPVWVHKPQIFVVQRPESAVLANESKAVRNSLHY